MKTLKEYSNNILTGKYILEKLKVGVKRANRINQDAEYDIPEIDDEYKTTGKVVRTVLAPLAKYVVYTDLYRQNKIHIATTDDMLMQMSIYADDYEGYDVNKHVGFADDDLQKMLKKLLKYLNVPFPKSTTTEEQFINNYYKATGETEENCTIVDDLSILYAFCMGTETLEPSEYFIDDDIHTMFDVIENDWQ